TKGKVGIGAGISYQFGGGEKKGREEIVIERPINKELEEQNKKLIEDNKRLEKANKDITDTIEELKERIKALEERKMNEFKLYTLTGYDVGKSELTDEQINRLKEILEELNRGYGDRKLYITGYTDSTSGEELNLELGLRRANKVLEKLMEHGLKVEIVKVSSSGYNNIVETNKNKRGKQSNRRVEIEVR
uniref:OmpA family protein n=2 Tax=Streptobacillus notomytis TaxID=1712031 RepID=UPI000B2D35D6